MTRIYRGDGFALSLHSMAIPEFPWGGEWRVHPGWTPQITMTAEDFAEFMAMFPH